MLCSYFLHNVLSRSKSGWASRIRAWKNTSMKALLWNRLSSYAWPLGAVAEVSGTRVHQILWILLTARSKITLGSREFRCLLFFITAHVTLIVSSFVVLQLFANDAEPVHYSWLRSSHITVLLRGITYRGDSPQLRWGLASGDGIRQQKKCRVNECRFYFTKPNVIMERQTKIVLKVVFF